MELILLIIVMSRLAGLFLCSPCEAALYGVTPTQVEVLRRGGIFGSTRLAQLRKRIDEPVAAAAPRAGSPGAMQLRTLQTIDGLGPTPSNTDLLAVPIEIMERIQRYRRASRVSDVLIFHGPSVK